MSIIKYFLYSLCVLFVGALLYGCGGDSKKGSPSPVTKQIQVSGVAQKGLFQSLKIQVKEYNKQTNSWAPKAEAQFSGSNYQVDVTENTLAVIEATGTFFNEATGETETLVEPIKTIIPPATQAASSNINLITHASSERFLATHAKNLDTPAKATLAQSESFVNGVFGFDASFDSKKADITQIKASDTLASSNVNVLVLSTAILEKAKGKNLDQLIEQVVESVANAKKAEDAQPVLGLLNGANAQTLYEQAASVIDSLPVLEWAEDPKIWLCDAVICQWKDQDPKALNIANTTIYESDARGFVRVSLPKPPAVDVPVSLAVKGGTATSKKDYILTTSATISAAATYVDIPIDLVIDNLDEPSETVELELSTAADGFTVANAAGLVTIKNGAPANLAYNANNLVSIDDLCLLDIAPTDYNARADCSAGDAVIKSIVVDGESAAHLKVKLTDSCSDNACAVPSSGILVELLLQAKDSNNAIQREVVLGQYRQPRSTLNQLTASPLLLAMQSEEAATSLFEAKANNWSTQIIARIPQKDSAQAVAAITSIPEAFPSVLTSGDWTFAIAEGATSAAGGAVCNKGKLISADFESPFVSVSGTSTVQASACIEVEVKEENGKKRLIASVSDGEMDITGLILPLADDHLLYVTNLGGLSDEGDNLGGISLPREFGLSVSDKFWLHVEGLPVSFKIKRGVVKPGGLYIEYDQIDYFMQPAFSVSDPRNGKPMASNDVVYSGLIGRSGEIKYTQNGIQTTLQVPAGKAKTAYPKGEMTWSAFNQPIVDGKLQPSSMSFTYELSQFSDCRKLGCNNNLNRRYAVTAQNLAMNANGLVHGQSQVVLPAGKAAVDHPAWGGIGSNIFAFSRPSDMQNSMPATLSLPGYRFSYSALTPSVGYYLQGHVFADASSASTTLESYLSKGSKQGNGFPVGISIGPQTYVNTNGQPDKGSGELLTDTELEINNGAKINKVKVSEAAKYVIRNSGITGVFNANSASLINPYSVSGYPLKLTRFAIRLTDNALDKYNWIDGDLAIEGDAGLKMHFTNFELDCSAQLGKAIVTYEQCDNTDNNSNNVVDENCPQRLKTWAAETQIYGMSFVPQNASVQNSNSCANSNQVLQLDQHIQFAALDKPIKAQAVWDNGGTLVSSTITLLDQYRLDTTEDDQGFLVQLRKAQLRNSNGNGRHGWLDTSLNDFFVPFWDSVRADIRVANKQVSISADPEAEPSIVTKVGSLKTLTNDQNDLKNTELFQLDIFEKTAHQILAKYEWGNTGFGFGLPVYYSPHRFNIENQSRFLGVQKNADLFVLEANAGIDFIESDRTKLSFGASADFKKLKSIKFQVDLDNPDNLKKVDKFLVDSGVVAKPVIEPALGYPQSLLAKVNRFANRGVDDIVRKHLEKGLKITAEKVGSTLPTGEDPFITTSKSLSWIKSLPQQLEILIRDKLQKPVNGIVNSSRQSLRSDLLVLKNKIDSVDQSDPIPADVYTTIERIKSTIRFFKAEINGIDRQITAPINQAKSIIYQANGYLNQLDAAIKEIDSILDQVAAFNTNLCTSQNAADEVKGYIEPFLTNLANIKLYLQFIEGGASLEPIVIVIAQDPSLQNNVRATQKELANKARELLTTVSEIETQVRTKICSAGINDVLAGAKSVTAQIQAERQFLSGVLGAIRNDITQLENLKNEIKSKFVEPIDQSYALISAIETEMKERRDQFQEAKLSDEVNRILAEATSGVITVLVVDNSSTASDRDITNVIFDDIQKEFNDTLEQSIRFARREIDRAFKVAYYTPDQLRQMLVNQIMNANPVNELRQTANQYLSEVNRKVNKIATDITDQVNNVVKTALAKVENDVNQALAAATAPVKNIPLDSASLDGYGIIAGNELERVHIGAEWIMSPAAEGEPPTSFNAALDATSWSASNKTTGCQVPATQSLIDVVISSRNLPAVIANTDITIKLVSLGFTLDQAGGVGGLLPKGVFGGISAIGDIGFTEFVIYDPAFAAGIGTQETYLGASAGALFSDIQMELAFFAGKSCNQDVLLSLDPDVAKFITLPPNGFAGFYARAAASIPIWTNGCALTVGVGADVGTWLFAGSPSTFGGLVGGRAYGQALCIAALAGKVTALAEVTTEGDVSFVGSGFGAAGVGWCEPAGWTTVKRSRDDSFCGTGDVQFSAGYRNGWKLFNIETSAVH